MALNGNPIKEETIIRLLCQYYTGIFQGSGVIMKRPRVFDYALDSYKGFRFYWELQKEKGWFAEKDRKNLIDTARRVFLVDHAVVSVYLNDLNTDGGKCPSCVFNKDLTQEGQNALRPQDGSIGSACPVRPGAVERVVECREYRLDIEEFLSFETTTSTPIAGVLGHGDKEREIVGRSQESEG
jgi:hypothetical protein